MFSGGANHIKLDDNLGIDGQQLFIAMCLKPVGEDTDWDNDYPRAWAAGDNIYLTVIKGTTSTSHKLEFYRRFSSNQARYQTTNDVLFDGVATVIALDWDDSQPSTPPTIYRDGAALQLSQLGVGEGTPLSNRQHEFPTSAIASSTKVSPFFSIAVFMATFTSLPRSSAVSH